MRTTTTLLGTIRPGTCIVAYGESGHGGSLLFADGNGWKETQADRLPPHLAKALYRLGRRAYRHPNAEVDTSGNVRLTQ